MSIESIYHGLTVLTSADSATDPATNKRLQRPVPQRISNCFNDATTGDLYRLKAGHGGIDFKSPLGTPVRAMYGGVVVAFARDYQADPSTYSHTGLYVIIESTTGSGEGFQHYYGHLAHPNDFLANPPARLLTAAEEQQLGMPNSTYTLKAGFTKQHYDDAKTLLNLKKRGEPGASTRDITVAKGGLLGLSGGTGTVRKVGNQNTDPAYHLHVQLRPFGCAGSVTSENVPVYGDSWEVKTPVAERISGRMDFSCFLPPDNRAHWPGSLQTPPPIEANGRLLSPRSWPAQITVHADHTAASQLYFTDQGTKAVTISGRHLGCYAVVDTYASGGTDPDWYKIKVSSTSATFYRKDIFSNVLPKAETGQNF